MDEKLKDKVAIVTGGASGFGEATVRLFAAHGAGAVVIADVQDDLGRFVVESIGSGRCCYFHCDVSDEEQVKALVDWTAQTYGRIDVMFSNAGIVRRANQTAIDLDLSALNDVMRVNAFGTAACVKHAARKMVELRTRGSIVCTASAGVVHGSPVMVDYAMSKHAVVGLMQSAFQKLGEHGIRINCVSPGLVATPLAQKFGLTSEVAEEYTARAPGLKGVVLTAEHVAEAVLYLASDTAAFLTGQNLVLDGGINYAMLEAMS